MHFGTDVHKNLLTVDLENIGEEKVVLSLWANMELYFPVYRETVWHYQSNERLGKVYVCGHGGRRSPSCLITAPGLQKPGFCFASRTSSRRGVSLT
jgi:hypothetical protein